MRWNLPEMPEGTYRWVRKFAFFPTKVHLNIYVWLESYLVEQKLVSGKWITENKYAIKDKING